MIAKPLKGEVRSMEQLREDYEIEKELAAKLRNAPREERETLYSSVYDEYFERVSQAPQLIRKSSSRLKAAAIDRQMHFLKPFLNRDTVFLEVGPGDCALSAEVARHVKRAYAVDVASNISGGVSLPDNCERIISDGSSIPVPDNSVTVVYSNQLMEHLHPDDAFDQLRNIYNAMAEGGYYICSTPNRLSGPHDISKYFDPVATGFHLKEYSVSELVELFSRAGFSHCRSYIGSRGRYIRIPVFLQRGLEGLLGALPEGLGARIGRSPLRILLGIQLVGKK